MLDDFGGRFVANEKQDRCIIISDTLFACGSVTLGK